MYMRASEASELRNFWHFHILKLLFLSIFCRYNRYFVGTNGMLVGLHVPTNFQNIPTNTNIEQMHVYASERSERAKKKLAFLHSYTAISLNILSVQQILCRYK